MHVEIQGADQREAMKVSYQASCKNCKHEHREHWKLDVNIGQFIEASCSLCACTLFIYDDTEDEEGYQHAIHYFNK